MAPDQKKAVAEQRTLVWVDEAGFSLLPSVVRTYAPRGEPAILRVPLTHEHLSVISGLTEDGRVLMQVQERAYKGPDVVGFLKHLMRQIRGKLLVIWDGAPIHRGEALKRFLTQGGSERVHIEQLPGYAAELNADEGVWQYLKEVEVKNVGCETSAELRWELRLATRRLRHKRDVLRACITHTGLAL